MSTEQEFHQLLRSAVPPAETRSSERDRWPDILRRGQTTAGLSPIDLGMAAVLAVALILFPRVAWLLAYHF